MYDGTLCTKGPWQALVTFQQLLVLADQDGNCDMTLQAISRRTTIPLDILTAGIAPLLELDPESRTPDAGGRRLIPLVEGRAWGWHIVNYEHYRQLKREEDRREYHRQYWHKRKEKVSTALNSTQPTQPNQPIAYAEAKEVNPSVAPRAPVRLNGSEAKTAATWESYSIAYKSRYGADPTRNKKVNGMLAQLLDRVPIAEAPAIAAFYVKSDRNLYTSSRHCVDLLLRDAEALRSDWQTKGAAPAGSRKVAI